jgi:hypothetical protein
MGYTKFAAPLLLALLAAAQSPLPRLRIEPTGGGSIFYIHNGHSEALTAYLIELVNYPGSSYTLWQDDPANAIPAGGDKKIQVANMTVGAVPDYVKMTAAIFADGTTAGIPAKVTGMLERRKAVLETTRELIRRCEKGPDRAAVMTDLQQWLASMPAISRSNRNSQEAINQGAAQSLIGEATRKLGTQSLEETLNSLRASEKVLAANKP